MKETIGKVSAKFEKRMQAVKELTYELGLPNIAERWVPACIKQKREYGLLIPDGQIKLLAIDAFGQPD